MLLLAPILTGATSPRIVTLNQMLTFAAISTSPAITAPGATNALGSIVGLFP